eukprot:CAMPEP_0182420312 /NCGR_PEP_ID=MMETSP1167-20130531/5037_1 /TAXON_ID=2988 /ORGANISM="Mallomonas Sp, Strain CCMP3275" /LENGTH=407 /DNA_ID=CAMNT_0024596129 /DNA_START=113 /DNA_END=1336 /DNA_ORIENTATION=+
MGNTDSVPVVSQTKSFVQYICHDKKGALDTQKNFSKTCPVVSQIRSLVEHQLGDDDAALDTQIAFIDGVDKFTDSIPILGHAKGLYAYAKKDKESGDRAMKCSSRTVGVIGGAALGALAAGPAGAFSGGIAGGMAMDGVITEADTRIHKQFRPHGYIAMMELLAEKEREMEREGGTGSKAGIVFDLLAGAASDGMIGLAATSRLGGKIGGRVRVREGGGGGGGAMMELLQDHPVLIYTPPTALESMHESEREREREREEERLERVWLQSVSRERERERERDVRMIVVHDDQGGRRVLFPPDLESSLSSVSLSGERERERDGESEDSYFEALNELPDVFFCPITTELMRDPMVCTDGHTYERHAIESWLSTRNTSPMTNIPLKNTDLVPNHALKSVIMNYCEARGLNF